MSASDGPKFETMRITRRVVPLDALDPETVAAMEAAQDVIAARLRQKMDDDLMRLYTGDPGYGHNVIDAQVIEQVPESHRLEAPPDAK